MRRHLVYAVTLALVYGVSRKVNRQNSPWRGVWIGLAVSGGLIAALHLLFYAGPDMLVRLLGQSSYLFWWGVPSLIFVSMTVWVGWKMRFEPMSG